MNYARSFLEEMESAIADNDAMDFERLSKMFPGAMEFVVTDAG